MGQGPSKVDSGAGEQTGRVNRLYAVLSSVNEVIVRAREPQQLYDAACRIAVEDGLFILAWVGFADDSGDVRSAASYGRDDGYLDSVRISLNGDVPEGQGPTGTALREGRPYINNDTENNPVMLPWREEQLKRGIRSSASFPLTSEGETIGVMTLYAGEPNYFDEEEIRLLECLADDFSFALEAAEVARQREKARRELEKSQEELETRIKDRTADLNKLYEERDAQATYAEALNGINRGVHSTLQFDQIMQRALVEIAEALGVDAIAVQVHAQDQWTFAYSHGLRAELRSARLPDSEMPLSMEMMRTRQPVVVNDVSADRRVNLRVMDRFGITGLMAVPLIVRGQVFGILIVARFGQPKPFSTPQLDFLQSAAAALALALENARLYEAEVGARLVASQELDTSRLLLATANILATWGGAETAFGRLAETLLESTDHGRVTLSIWDERRKELRTVVSSGQQALSPGAHSFDALSLHIKQVIADKRVTVFDYAAGPMGQTARQAETHVLRLGLLVPIVYQDRLLGLIGVDSPGEECAFTQREIGRVEAVASQAAVAMENARLLESTQESSRLSGALNEVSVAVHSTLEIDRVMPRALETGLAALHCDAGVIEMREGEEWAVRHQHGFPQSEVGSLVRSDQAPIAARAMESGRPVAIADLSSDVTLNVGFVRRYSLKSVLAVPLFAQGLVIGCALFFSSQEVRRFRDAELDFGAKLGLIVALGLENARLYQSEHGIAETLQQALLSLPEGIDGYEFAPFYQSATLSTLVGGDFYDVFELGEGRTGITIGDVSGKGLKAAVMTSLVKNTIRAHANESSKTPGQVLTLTNDLIHKSTPAEAFASVFFAVLDRDDGSLTYANAGHTTGAILRSDGTCSRLEGTGCVIGAVECIEIAHSGTRLGHGDLLFLYTDGLTEARGVDRDFYGEDRLFNLLSASPRQSAKKVVAKTMADVMAFSADRLADDLAVLALRRAPDSGQLPI